MPQLGEHLNIRPAFWQCLYFKAAPGGIARAIPSTALPRSGLGG
jgi:hypothetical protein